MRTSSTYKRLAAAAAICATILQISTSCLSAMTDKEIIDTINKITLRMRGGEIDAIQDLKSLPSDSAVVALLMYYRQNKYVYRHTPKNKTMTEKCAKLLTEIPGADTYLIGLLKKLPPGSPPNAYSLQRQAAIACLIQTHDKLAVRVLAEALGDTDIPELLAKGLADQNIPGAPFSSQTAKGAATPEGIAKWKEWWEANKSQYTDAK